MQRLFLTISQELSSFNAINVNFPPTIWKMRQTFLYVIKIFYASFDKRHFRNDEKHDTLYAQDATRFKA